MRSIITTNTRNKNSEKDDFYATHPDSIIAFLDKLKDDKIELPKNIWECACGQGHISEILLNYGYNVFSSDLVDRGYEKAKAPLDFLSSNFKNVYDVILTNPPYSLSIEFLKKAHSLVKDNGWVILLLALTFLESVERYDFFVKEKKNPKYVYVYSARQGCGRGGGTFENTGARAYAMFMWQKGFVGETTLRWIPPNK